MEIKKFELSSSAKNTEQFNLQPSRKQRGILLKTNLGILDTIHIEGSQGNGHIHKMPIVIREKHIKVQVAPFNFFSFEKNIIDPNTIVKGEIVLGDDYELLLYELNINPMSYKLSYNKEQGMNFLIGEYSSSHILARQLSETVFEVQLFVNAIPRDMTFTNKFDIGSDTAQLIESIYNRVKSACDNPMYAQMLADKVYNFEQNLNYLFAKHTHPMLSL